ncbi:MAG TPA: DNA methyltransferase [Bradyrhizobium sp.]|jgi:DNA modification methylase|nr:DNA methyltransferase [Bradyrhizobium sp.]
MSRERIVLETTNERKAALVRTLDLQGDTLSDWLEEQLALSVPDVERAIPKEVESATISEIEDSDRVVAKLKAQNWAFTNDDTRYLTHDLHPYPAKFIPQIPAHLIAALSVPGDIVFDPFGGSATTAVEAVRLGRRALSLDANPLSGLIGRVKTGFMTPIVRAELNQLQATVASYIASSEIKKIGWKNTTVARHQRYVPDIPNIAKWFHENAIAELALLRFLISETTTGLAKDAALLALSRIILRVSFQESETRYVAEPKDIPTGFTLQGFQESLRTIERRLNHAASELHRADASFLVGDGRTAISSEVGHGAVDLIVTSPPYPNATDYHLYHRFRLFWLGFDPRELGAIEIGSHLRHQRNGSGFEEYSEDMSKVLSACYSALRAGRYAVFIVGDALFKGKTASTSKALIKSARNSGFEFLGVIDRPIHGTKRSFTQAARRARKEQIVVLRKPNQAVNVTLIPPGYQMWDYETVLRKLEIESLAGIKLNSRDLTKSISISASLLQLSAFRRLTFSSEYKVNGDDSVAQPTWQKILENGDAESAKRKDPKYATHGLHPYKGKFYPQLAKALINIAGVPSGARILDPFCGSGTVLLEGMLNGFAAYGCDMHPLAAKISRAKTEIFSVDRGVTEHALRSLLDRVRRPPPRFAASRDQFKSEVLGELDNWFPTPVLDKLEWVLGQVRLFGEPRLVEFTEIILSSIIRDVSQQDPSDLRIRRREKPISDAPVIELFEERLQAQLNRLIKYWSIAGRQPGTVISPVVHDGDCRQPSTFKDMGLNAGKVDCVVTSPPYATALPYIDTDRLSLMAIMGIASSKRSDLEENLTGSREIRKSGRVQLEETLMSPKATDVLPTPVVSALRNILTANRSGNVGFRRENMGALLWRYFADMHANLRTISKILKPNGVAYYVVGDSRTNAGGTWTAIETCRHIREIAEMAGLKSRTLLDISVSTESYKHIKNAITKNAVLEFRVPG